jgi:hypothetical protein
MKEKEWREKAIAYLQAGKFGDNYCCCMKFREAGKTDQYTKFGKIFPVNVTKVFLLDTRGAPTGETQVYGSIEAMLDAGWDVD